MTVLKIILFLIGLMATLVISGVLFVICIRLIFVIIEWIEELTGWNIL